MRKIVIKDLLGFIGVIVFLLSLGAQTGETDWKKMETRLPLAAGKEKFDLLVKLTGYYSGNDPKKAISYGGQVLELLKDFPDFPGTTAHVELLNALSLANASAGSNEEAQKYAQKARELAKKINDRKGYAKAVYNLGRMYQFKSSYEQALTHLEEALKIFKEMGSWEEIGKVFNMKGMIYGRINDYSNALENFLESARAYEKLEDKNKCLPVYNNIGVIYDETDDYENALRYYNKALEIAKGIDHKRATSFAIHNIATIYRKQGKYSEALEYAKESLKITEAIGDKRKMVFDISFMGEIHRDLNRPQQALKYFSRSLELAKQVNERERMAEIFCFMGALKGQLGQYTEAVSWLKQAVILAAKIKALNEERNAVQELYKVYAAMKNPAKALEYHIRYKQLDDEILNKEKNEKLAVLQVRFDFERKNREIELLKKDQQIRKLKMRRQKNLIYYFIIISLLIMIAAVVTFNRYRFKVRINRKLSEEIEKHKKTACKLRESEEKFRAMAEKSLVGIYIIQDNLFKYINPRFLEIFGYTADEFAGRAPLEVILEEDRPLVAEHIRRRLEGEINAVNYQFRGITKQGNAIFLESFGSRFLYLGKSAVIGTLIDITDRKKAEEELLRSRKLEAVGILSAGIAHDFNNLLAVIVGNLGIAKAILQEPHPEPAPFIERAEQASIQATELVKKFLTISEGDWVMKSKVTLPDVLKETIDSSPQLRKISDAISLPKDLEPLYGDERQLRQLMVNLLLNAHEATSGMDRDKKIEISAEKIILSHDNQWKLDEGEYIKVSVTDNGKGIPEDLIGKIFDPYFSTKERGNQKGMGMGLAVSYAIVKKHGGHISVASTLHEGTTFDVYLPVFKEETGPEV